ncbi:hypothetical protein LCGC14_2404930, partial [marine sediment metagenome]
MRKENTRCLGHRDEYGLRIVQHARLYNRRRLRRAVPRADNDAMSLDLEPTGRSRPLGAPYDDVLLKSFARRSHAVADDLTNCVLDVGLGAEQLHGAAAALRPARAQALGEVDRRLLP